MSAAAAMAFGPRRGVPLPLPADVRTLNAAAAFCAVLAVGVLAAAGLAWLMRTPWFPVRAVELEGDLQRNSLSTLRANAMPKLAGNFFGTDLSRAQSAFESVPWVRRAVVRRVWPDRLSVRLEEHRAVALWAREAGEDLLVNGFGEVFEANVGDVEDDDLPQLAGPEGSAPRLLAMLQALKPLMAAQGRELQRVTLSDHGSWRLVVDGDVAIEIGRGTDAEVQLRAERFVRTLTQVTSRFRAPLLHADLRHPGGYAVRLRGVTTTTAPAATPARSTP